MPQKRPRLVAPAMASLMESEDAAHHASFHDALTGLPNRELFDQRLEHALVLARRRLASLAVMFLELEDMRAIDGLQGAEAAQRALSAMAERLKENTRAYDTLSRHGGGQFLFLLEGVADAGDVRFIAENAIRAIREPYAVRDGGPEAAVTIQASVGIAIFPEDGSTVEALVNRAHQAMYRAKRESSGYSFAADCPPGPGPC